MSAPDGQTRSGQDIIVEAVAVLPQTDLQLSVVLASSWNVSAVFQEFESPLLTDYPDITMFCAYQLHLYPSPFTPPTSSHQLSRVSSRTRQSFISLAMTPDAFLLPGLPITIRHTHTPFRVQVYISICSIRVLSRLLSPTSKHRPLP